MARDFTPHDYQEEVMDWIAQRRRCAIWAPMGGGKTVSTLTALERLSVVDDVYPALVLAPLRVARTTWPEEVEKWNSLKHLRVSVISGTPKQRERAARAEADIYTTNYDNIVWLRDFFGEAWPFKTVIADECFVAGTKIGTPQGEKPIETLKAGDMVNTHAGPKPIASTHKRFTNALNLVCLKLSNGDQIRVTAEHPFFTDLGWLPARACGGRRLYGRDCLSDLSNALSAQSHKGARAGTKASHTVLRPGMPNQGHFQQPARTSRASCPDYAPTERGMDDILELWEAMVRCPSGEDVAGPKGPNLLTISRRERDWHVSDRSSDCTTDAGRLYMELCNTVGRLWAGLSVKLQAGFCGPKQDDLFGGGRSFPPHAARSGARQAKDRAVTVLGVDVAPDRQREGVVAVFNLEVEGAPTYFAAGFLVHNCTRLKSFRLRQGGSRARALGQVAHTAVERFIGLTGTPSPNGIKDLWGQMWFLDQGERLGRTFSAFEQRWFRKGYDGFSLVPYEHAQSEVQERLRDICLTVTGLPVDEPIVAPVYVDLPGSVQTLYRTMEDKFYAEVEGSVVEAANAAVKTQKLLQLANGTLYVDDEGNWEEVHSGKLDALESVIEEANGAPVLVAYNFRHDLERLRRNFPKARVLDTDPDTIRAWNAGEIPILLAHPASAGHGLNLADGGNILAFYGVNWNLEEHMQIIERIGPMRQKQAGHDRPCLVYPILARNTVDEVVMERLSSKRSIQEVLLEAMKRKRAGA